MNDPARLRQNILALSILQALNYVAPLITVPYLVRVLGPENFGLLSFAQALIIYFDVVSAYGFGLSATRAVACCRREPPALAAVFWRTTYARASLMLASAAVLAVAIAAVPHLRATPLLYAAAFLTVVGTVTFPVWFFQGLEQMRFITFAQASARALSIPALLLCVRHPEDYLRAAAIQGGVPVLASVFIAPVLWARVPAGLPRPCVSEILQTLKDGWHVFVTQMGMVAGAATTTVVLGFVAGSTAVGYYAAAEKVIRAVTSMLGPVAQALYPHLANLKGRSLDLTLKTMRKSFAWIALLALAASLATFFLAGPVGLLLWGRGFAPSVAVLRCLSPLPFVLALINILGTQTMLVFEMDALLSRIVLAGAAANLVLAAALSSVFGVLGAAAATVVSGVLISGCLAWSVRRNSVLICA
jgi:PST family polysaccharide transporter